MATMYSAIKGQRGPHKNAKSKMRNASRRQFRRDHPEHRGKQLHRWPLDELLAVKAL